MVLLKVPMLQSTLLRRNCRARRSRADPDRTICGCAPMMARCGAWTEFHVNAPSDQAPVAGAADFTASHNQSIAASSLFSVTDADHDAITAYQLWDSTADPASGHWIVNGAAQGAGVAIDVTPAQLSSTTFQSGSGSDDLWVRGSDGTMWGAWTDFTSTLLRTRPRLLVRLTSQRSMTRTSLRHPCFR